MEIEFHCYVMSQENANSLGVKKKLRNDGMMEWCRDIVKVDFQHLQSYSFSNVIVTFFTFLK